MIHSMAGCMFSSTVAARSSSACILIAAAFVSGENVSRLERNVACNILCLMLSSCNVQNMDQSKGAVSADTRMQLNRLKKLRQLWSEAPSVVLRSGHSRRCPERLQSRALEREVARRISACGRNAGVSKLIAYGYQINPSLEHRNCAGMSQKVWPYSGWKSRIGLMKGCRMLGKNMMDAVPSEPLAA